MTICEFCAQNNREFKSNLCEHSLRGQCLNEDIVDEFDSEFDVDNFDSMVGLNGHQVCDSTHEQAVNDHTYHSIANDFAIETENKYDTIDAIKTSDESNCLDKSENNDKSEEEEEQQQEKEIDDNQIKEPVVTNQCESNACNECIESTETYETPKPIEKSLSEV